MANRVWDEPFDWPTFDWPAFEGSGEPVTSDEGTEAVANGAADCAAGQ